MGFSVASNKKYKPRKPRPLGRGWWIFDAEGAVCHSKSGILFYGPKDIRKLGEWLLKAADYLESKEK